MEYGKLLSYLSTGSQVVLQYEKQNVTLDFITDEIVNVFVPIRSSEHYSKAIEGDKHVPVVLSEEKDGDRVFLSTGKLKVEVKDDFVINFYRADGTLLLEDYVGERSLKCNVSEFFVNLLKAEGHDTTNLYARNYPVQTVKKLTADQVFYGLGDKSGFLNKRNFEYENWNSDLPTAHNEDYKSLYKSIPFLIGLRPGAVYGLFFDNTFHSYLNLGKESREYFYYGADDGNLDYYFMGGESMADVIKNYTYLTGRTPLPQLWTLGYHQSRWGYACRQDFEDLMEKFRTLQIPCDALHFDIDYMDGYRVFTWNEKDYGAPGEIWSKLEEKGFKPVCIIDPGVKKDEEYFMDREGMENGYYATDPQTGEVYVNKVWPGESHFPDFGRKEVRDWWSSKHKILTDWGVRGVWNDMNEPASFDGELPADVIFHEEERVVEHKEMHNVYGHHMARATYQGLKDATGKRPFVITRACYSGTQKYSTVWTGDNQSLWHHLQMVIPQLCNLGMSGFGFAGTDIGGFGADTNPELLTRWIEAAVFSPLMRNHSAAGSIHQEPWCFGQQVTDIYRKYVNLRYRFLPYIYDLFYQGQETGLPVMRPLVLHYEDDPEVYNLNGEFLVGESLLVAPVLEQGATKKAVYLPKGIWYDFWTHEKLEGGQYYLVDAPIDHCPMYVKEGSIIPMYDVVQYVGEKPYDTLHLLVTPGKGSYAHFQDNGEDFDYLSGAYNLYGFSSENGKVQTTMLHEGYEKYKEIIVEKF